MTSPFEALERPDSSKGEVKNTMTAKRNVELVYMGLKTVSSVTGLLSSVTAQVLPESDLVGLLSGLKKLLGPPCLLTRWCRVMNREQKQGLRAAFEGTVTNVRLVLATEKLIRELAQHVPLSDEVLDTLRGVIGEIEYGSMIKSITTQASWLWGVANLSKFYTAVDAWWNMSDEESEELCRLKRLEAIQKMVHVAFSVATLAEAPPIVIYGLATISFSMGFHNTYRKGK